MIDKEIDVSFQVRTGEKLKRVKERATHVSLQEVLRVINTTSQITDIHTGETSFRSEVSTDGGSFRDGSLNELIVDGKQRDGVFVSDRSTVPVGTVNRTEWWDRCQYKEGECEDGLSGRTHGICSCPTL